MKRYRDREDNLEVGINNTCVVNHCIHASAIVIYVGNKQIQWGSLKTFWRCALDALTASDLRLKTIVI